MNIELKDSVIIVSGGMDSVTLLYEYAESIALAISFDYGANHNAKEIPLAAMHCEHLGIEHLIIPLAFMSKYFTSSLLEGADAIPEGHYEDENMKSTVVPFRNGIMLSIAAGLAESKSLDVLVLGNHSGDHTIYPDCRPEFIAGITEAIFQGTCNNVEVVSPFCNITKTDIVKLGKELGVDFALTYSCYKGGELHCGKCGTCQERIEAFQEAGVKDPTNYI